MLEYSNLQNISILKTGWSGVSSPYSYSITNGKIKSDSILDLIINCNTKELIDKISSYQISGYKQEVGKITIYAWGNKPDIDLQASLVVRGGY